MINAIPIVAENRIREAIEQGMFDHLAGQGQPLPDIDGNYQPDWWLRKKLQREQLAPDEVALVVERLKQLSQQERKR
jgi:hypothetical protein